jgi:NAD(P)-dependent dehydrogenase (short-subunit alcohol dehydrogenase family)
LLDIKGQVAFVTGAASGLGLGIARTFARAGAKVAMADVEREALERARADVEGLQATALAIALDVSDAAAVAEAVARTEAELGPIDIAVNNAGVELSGRSLDELSQADLDWIVDVNIKGVLNGIRAIVPGMRARRSGYLVNVASIAGLQVNERIRGMGAYALTKYAVVAMSESLRLDLAPDGITVSVLCPGAVKTDIWRSQRNRPERFGGPLPDDRANAFRQLLEDEGLHPDDAGRVLLHAMADKPMFILTDPRMRAIVEARHDRITAGFDLAQRVLTELGLAR